MATTPRKKVTDFDLPTNGDGRFKLSDHTDKGERKIVVLYFYPKDSTPGCTTDGVDFDELIMQCREVNALGRAAGSAVFRVEIQDDDLALAFVGVI